MPVAWHSGNNTWLLLIGEAQSGLLTVPAGLQVGPFRPSRTEPPTIRNGAAFNSSPIAHDYFRPLFVWLVLF